MRTHRWITLGLVLSAMLAIAGASMGGDAPWIHYLFKPVATLLVWYSVLRAAVPVGAAYRKAILAGLALSLCGDVFLMLPKTLLPLGFELGLASFLIAHLFFLRAFTRDARLFGKLLPLVLLLLVSCANLAILWPTIGAALRIPVLAYMICLVGMTAQAASRALSLGTRGSWLAALGAVFFLVSDTTLAFNKFHAPLPASALLVLGTYYTALYLIARSVPAETAPVS
jgi:uncharacterized membrane protein YhhN